MTAMLVGRRGPAWALAGLIALALSCADPQGTEPNSSVPALARGAGGGPSVTSTDPSYGDQGAANLDVRVFGSGFDQSSRASWEKNGVAYAKITVNRTTFVSSGELVANLTIAADATVDFYDVAVYAVGGKKGIGTELFEVTTAVPLPNAGHANGINDAGQVVGGESGSGNAFFWDPGSGTTQTLDHAFAFDIDQAGSTLVGARWPNAGSVAWFPVYWTRLSGLWQMQDLPAFGSTGQARALVSDPVTGEAVLAVGWAVQPLDKRTSLHLPVKWTRSAGTGWTISILPSGGTGASDAWDVNASGMIVGSGPLATGTSRAVVWDVAGNVTVLDPINPGAAARALGINRDGGIVVGSSNNRAMMWTRNADGSWNPLPVDLDVATAAPSCPQSGGDGRAIAINAAGVIVGQSCGVAYAWRVSGRSVLGRIRLGGLGSKSNEGSWASSINDASPATAAGKATDGAKGSNAAVIWRGL